MKIVEVLNLSSPSPGRITAEYCTSFWSKFRGLMFRRRLSEHAGIILADNSQSKVNSAIHMLFMNFDIAVIWIDSAYRVVDVKIARRWQPMVMPKSPAQYILETHPDRIGDFHIGDLVEFAYV